MAKRFDIPFVESKEPNWRRVATVTAPSVRAGRWANFGPVNDTFAARVTEMIGGQSDRVVVPSSSATTALYAVAGMHASRANRPLVWAVSAFGFVSTVIGPLAGRVRIVDCDEHGMADLHQLEQLDPHSWDGLIVTDVFGKGADLRGYQSLCDAQGKPLVVDAAVSFPTRRPGGITASVVVSFHHTKPWGFGEGGCAVVAERDAALVQSFLNFGVGIDPAFAGYATNGKMSDLAAAAIVDRLRDMEDWGVAYRHQRLRIRTLAEAEGLDVLVDPPEAAVTPHVPVLASRPWARDQLPPTRFAVAKYYRPLSAVSPMAAHLYGRIVNIPCHPGMAAVPNDEIGHFFRVLARR